MVVKILHSAREVLSHSDNIENWTTQIFQMSARSAAVSNRIAKFFMRLPTTWPTACRVLLAEYRACREWAFGWAAGAGADAGQSLFRLQVEFGAMG